MRNKVTCSGAVRQPGAWWAGCARIQVLQLAGLQAENFLPDLAQRLVGLSRPHSPFAGVPADSRKGAIWVEPRLMAQVKSPVEVLEVRVA